jgi:DNA-binding transcriptional ArsR family regulator
MTEKIQDKSRDITLGWDCGSAYELFVSLNVLHNPEYHGVRASWAAGIRSRIPTADRKFLEDVIPFISFPLIWIYRLPEPKDAISAIWALRQIPAADRMLKLLDVEHWNDIPAIRDMILKITKQRSWSNHDLAAIKDFYKEKRGEEEKNIDKYLDWWARPDEFGDAMLAGLQAYYQAFFEGEEKRIAPVLQAGLTLAQEKAKHFNVPDLIAELSQGVRFDDIKVKELIIVPAFWTTPLVVMDEIDENLGIFLFGARPATMAAIPGELVPDGLLRTLKALADPTRLKILHYLSNEELTPSVLARRLNLRAPTVTHHLRELRLSGLVNLRLKGQENLYGVRREALDMTIGNLHEFLENATENTEK